MNDAVSPSAVALLTLMKIRGLGRRVALKLVDEALTESDLVQVWERAILRQPDRRVSRETLLDAKEQVELELQQSEQAGIQAFSFHDAGYPQRLRDTPDPPAVLFVKGRIESLHAGRCLAVVGTREPTAFGAEVAQRSARVAAEAGFAIISGLAHGCDTQAHRGCVAVHGRGVAVLAHGLDKVYPAANRELAVELLETGGCLVSEYPVHRAPARAAFAERDRIQSGLADGVLVIETAEKGGTMHTVRFAREQGRPLACIAHPEKYLSEDKSKGNQLLIRDGWATAIRDGAALDEFLDQIAHSAAKTENEVREPTPRQSSWTF